MTGGRRGMTAKSERMTAPQGPLTPQEQEHGTSKVTGTRRAGVLRRGRRGGTCVSWYLRHTVWSSRNIAYRVSTMPRKAWFPAPSTKHAPPAATRRASASSCPCDGSCPGFRYTNPAHSRSVSGAAEQSTSAHRPELCRLAQANGVPPHTDPADAAPRPADISVQTCFAASRVFA